VRQYSDNPKKIEIGDEYGDFEVKEINSNTISLSLFEREELLGDWVKFQVSEKGWWGYAYTEKECAAPEGKESAGNPESLPAETPVANSTPTTAPTSVADTSGDVSGGFRCHKERSCTGDWNRCRASGICRVSGFSLLSSLDFLWLPTLDRGSERSRYRRLFARPVTDVLQVFLLLSNAEGRCARYIPPSFTDMRISSRSSSDPATALLPTQCRFRRFPGQNPRQQEIKEEEGKDG
jgi:hypothetical protein